MRSADGWSLPQWASFFLSFSVLALMGEAERRETCGDCFDERLLRAAVLRTGHDVSRTRASHGVRV